MCDVIDMASARKRLRPTDSARVDPDRVTIEWVDQETGQVINFNRGSGYPNPGSPGGHRAPAVSFCARCKREIKPAHRFLDLRGPDNTMSTIHMSCMDGKKTPA